MRIKLTKLEKLPGAKYNTITKGSEREGEYGLPSVGACFYMQYNEGTDLWFRTSTVTEIVSKDDKQCIFKTLNSLYRIEFL